MSVGKETPKTSGRRNSVGNHLSVNDEETIAPRLLSVDTASIVLGISSHALRHRISEGLIPYVRMGKRRIMIDVHDIESFISENKLLGG